MSTRANATRAKAERLAQRRAMEKQAASAAAEDGEKRAPATAVRSPQRVERTKPVRVSLDLAPQLYRDLSEWNSHTAAALGRSRITHADTLRVLVRRLLNDPDLAASVIDDLRA